MKLELRQITQLRQIEAALRKQIGRKNTGLYKTVFVGVSWAYGWDISNVAEYLSISTEEAEKRLNDFVARMKDGARRTNNGNLFVKWELEEGEEVGKSDATSNIFSKAWLTIRCIEFNSGVKPLYLEWGEEN